MRLDSHLGGYFRGPVGVIVDVVKATVVVFP